VGKKTAREVIRQTVTGLPEPLRSLVASSIRFVIRKKPTAADLELGAKPDDRGIFIGLPVLEHDGDDAGELYAEEGEELGQHESAAVLRADEGDLVAELEPYTPGGTIAIFTGNIRPFTEKELVDVVLHELAHFAGEDEEGALELGLSDHSDAEGGGG
jgi:hypothetical protein